MEGRQNDLNCNCHWEPRNQGGLSVAKCGVQRCSWGPWVPLVNEKAQT